MVSNSILHSSFFFLQAMAERLCLRWENFSQTVSSVFGNLRVENDLTDVTLACMNGQQLPAHKVILAASSPTMRNLFRMNSHPHPVIFLPAVEASIVSAVLDYLYFGEANVENAELESFLALADQLGLDGLNGPASENKQPLGLNDPASEMNKHPLIPNQHFQMKTRDAGDFRCNIPSPPEDYSKPINSTGGKIEKESMKTSPQNDSSAEAKKNISRKRRTDEFLDFEVKSMMEMTQNMIRNGRGNAKRHSYSCKVCGKEGHGSNIKNHIKANHMEGLSVPCNICDKIFRSRNALGQHILSRHTLEKNSL